MKIRTIIGLLLVLALVLGSTGVATAGDCVPIPNDDDGDGIPNYDDEDDDHLNLGDEYGNGKNRPPFA